MSSVFNLDDDPIVLVVPSSANIPPGNISETEWAALKDRVTVVESSNFLANLQDVDTAGEDGTALIKQPDGSFGFGAVSGAINRIGNAGEPPEDSAYGVSWISLRSGLEFRPSGSMDSGTVFIQPSFGTTDTTVARGSHAHRLPSSLRPNFGPTGYMSGGTRQLTSTSITLVSGVTYRIVARLRAQMRGADAGAGYYRMTVRIGEYSRTSPAGEAGLWCVQGVPKAEEWSMSALVDGTGSSVTVSGSISYHSGAGFNVDMGELEVMAFPQK